MESRKTFTETSRVLGEGTFGRVVVVVDQDGRNYAKKICTYKKYIDSTFEEQRLMELLRKDPSHAGYHHVIQLVDALPDEADEGVELVMDLYDGCLLDLMRNKDEDEVVRLGEEIVQDVARHISLGLSYMNECGLVHGDLKPENILWKRSATSKSGYHFALADFGIAQELKDEPVFAHIQTRNYRCVENILDAPIQFQCDMTSLGCILYEAITGDYLVDEFNEEDHIASMLERVGSNTLSVWQRYQPDSTCYMHTRSKKKHTNAQCFKQNLTGDVALPRLAPFLEQVQSRNGDLLTDDNEHYTLLHKAFDDLGYVKRDEMVDFIIRCILPFPAQRLPAKDAWQQNLFS
jgi:serine/threonine protein kinase